MMSEILREEFLDPRHRLDRFRHHLAAAVADLARADRELVGLLGVLRILLHRCGNLLHRRRGLFQACGLLLRSLRQVGRARRNLAGGVRHLAGRGYDRTDGLLQLANGRIEVALHFLVFVGEFLGDPVAERAFGKLLKPFAERIHDVLHLRRCGGPRRFVALALHFRRFLRIGGLRLRGAPSRRPHRGTPARPWPCVRAHHRDRCPAPRCRDGLRRASSSYPTSCPTGRVMESTTNVVTAPVTARRPRNITITAPEAPPRF